MAKDDSAMTEFEMTQEDLDRLMDASKPVPWFAPGGVWPKTPRENAEQAWARLGAKMGFRWQSVKPHPTKGQRFFMATAMLSQEDDE